MDGTRLKRRDGGRYINRRLESARLNSVLAVLVVLPASRFCIQSAQPDRHTGPTTPFFKPRPARSTAIGTDLLMHLPHAGLVLPGLSRASCCVLVSDHIKGTYVRTAPISMRGPPCTASWSGSGSRSRSRSCASNLLSPLPCSPLTSSNSPHNNNNTARSLRPLPPT